MHFQKLTTLLTLAFVFAIQFVFAQNNISGKVIDAGKKGIPYANVLLLSPEDSTLVKGVVTDQDGNFKITNISPASYIIQSYMIGFGKSYSSLFNIDGQDLSLPDILLEEASTLLETVTIEADKPIFEQSIDRLIINVEGSPIMAGNSVIEVLEKSPGIFIDRQSNSISISGKNGVNVMIDGKLNRMSMEAAFAMLEGRSSQNIEKIEIITTPPANFDAQGNAGFINIVQKKNDFEGLNGTASASVGHGRRELFSFGGSMNYRRKKFSLFGEYNFDYRRINHLWKMTNIIENESYSLLSNSSNNRFGGADLSTGRIGADYYLTPKTTISFLTDFFLRDWSQNTDNNAFFDINPGIDTLMTGVRIEQHLQSQYLINFNVQHKFNDLQQIVVNLDYLSYLSDQDQTYDNSFFTDNEDPALIENIRISKESPISFIVSSIDYTHNLEGIKLETGLRATLNMLQNDIRTEQRFNGTWLVNDLFSDFSTMDENVLAAYGSVELNFSPSTSFKGGLRYEHTVTDIEDSLGLEVVYRNYGNFFPSVFLSQKLGKSSNFNLAYVRRINRPNFGQLAPFVIFLDPRTFQTGNTLLLPALNNSIKASMTVRRALLSLQYSRINNGINAFQPGRLDGTDQIVLLTENMDKTNQFNLAISVPVIVNDWWQMSNNFSGSRIRNQSSTVDISATNYRFNSSQRFQLPNDFSFELSGIYFSGLIFGISELKPFGSLNVGLRKQIGENGGVLSFNYSDLFRTNIRQFEGALPEQGLRNFRSQDFDTRFFRISYSKSFGNRKVQSGNRRKSSSQEELRRVR